RANGLADGDVALDHLAEDYCLALRYVHTFILAERVKLAPLSRGNGAARAGRPDIPHLARLARQAGRWGGRMRSDAAAREFSAGTQEHDHERNARADGGIAPLELCALRDGDDPRRRRARRGGGT